MNVYITKMNGASWNPLQNRQWMIAKIAHEMGCREMGIFCYNGSNESIESLKVRIDGIVAGLSWGVDIVICQFPTGNGFRFEWELVDRLKVYQIQVIMFIQESEIFFDKYHQVRLEEKIKLYNRAAVLIVPSMAMRQFLLDNGLREDMKFVVQEMWDYTVGMNLLFDSKFSRDIYYVNRGKIGGISDWNYTLQLKLFANSAVQGRNVQHIGELSQEELFFELSKGGGLGLIWYQEDEQRRGLEFDISFDLSRYLAAGIPVIVPKGISHQDMIERNHLGLAADSLDEAVEQVDSMEESDYQEYVRYVRRFSTLIRNGYFTKKLLVDVIQMLIRQDMADCAISTLTYKGIKQFSAYTKNNVNIMGMEETLEYVRTRKISVARFGDGEVFLMTGRSISYQDYDEGLAKRLKQIITMPDNKKLLVCLPDIFERKERYNGACIAFWERHLEKYRDFWDEVIISEKCYGSAFFSRPYMDLVDKSISGRYFQNMKDFFANKSILIVEGAYSQSGVGNDLFQEANSVERIICPSRNAYSKYEMILDTIREYGINKLILLMLGPTAKVLASDLAFEGYWAIDIGHIDSEYEWYKMGVTRKTKLKNKHTAEFNFDNDIELKKDDIYISEIVATLSE